MNLSVARTEKPGFTPGRFYIDTVFECYSLEDEVREPAGASADSWKSWKVHGKTAIPRGRYRVIVSFSNRFQKKLPEILNVPGWSGVRIHPGNTDKDTEGCLLLGDEDAADGFMGESRKAFGRVFAKIEKAINTGDEVWITIA